MIVVLTEYLNMDGATPIRCFHDEEEKKARDTAEEIASKLPEVQCVSVWFVPEGGSEEQPRHIDTIGGTFCEGPMQIT